MTDFQADRTTYRAILRSLRPVLLAVVGFSALINVLMLTGSVYMLQVYDRVLASGSVPTLLGLFAIVVLLYGFLGFYDFVRVRLLSRTALRLDRGLGRRAFGSWVSEGLSETRAGGAPPLRDLETVRGFLSSPAVTALFDLPFVPLFLGVLFLIHPWLGWLTVAGAAVSGLLALVNRAITQRPIQHAATLDGAERVFVDQGRLCADTVVAMGMQPALTSRWVALHEATLAGSQQGGDPSEMLAATSRAFRMLLQSAILTLGAFLVLGNEISAGMIIAASVLSGRALAPLDQVIGSWRVIGRGLAAHQRLKGLFDDPAAAVRPIDLPEPTGHVNVRRLTRLGPKRTAGEPGREQARILSQISFDLEPGDGLGVIGKSASGKSTLARLLVGAIAADEGEIRIDGATYDQWEPARRGRRFGYLPQTPELIPGTLRDNIARFDPAATDGEVIAAGRLAGIHDMILALPNGYATEVGQPGAASPLSGGQMQRVGLARAVFGMPALVVLDEPNANLDQDGNAALNRAVAALRAAGSVVVVMAHRTSALSELNKLLLLEAGRMRIFGDKDRILSGQVAETTLAPDRESPARRTALQEVPAARPEPALHQANHQPRPANHLRPLQVVPSLEPAPRPAPLPAPRPAPRPASLPAGSERQRA